MGIWFSLHFFRAAYQLAQDNHIETMVAMVKDSHYNRFYKKFGGMVMEKNLGHLYGVNEDTFMVSWKPKGIISNYIRKFILRERKRQNI